ncbi:hypothetical protein AB0J47_22720 [Nocardia sp. NPDC049737]|uniref:hypothetical protein n=1 Tax=Nocardia sp. NPDC049737 TaxID=3154358 RepID=UPI0034312866
MERLSAVWPGPAELDWAPIGLSWPTAVEVGPWVSWTPVVVAAADEVVSECVGLDEDAVSVWVWFVGVDVSAVEGRSLPAVTGGSWEESV